MMSMSGVNPRRMMDSSELSRSRKRKTAPRSMRTTPHIRTGAEPVHRSQSPSLSKDSASRIP